MLAGCGAPATDTRILGRPWPLPFGIAPTAYHALAHPDGEVAAARAAGRLGVPLVASTFASRAFEDITGATIAPLWLQVYCFRDRATTRELGRRAEAAGFEVLLLTVDAPHLGRWLCDLRNDFRLPDGVAPANLSGGGFSSPGGHTRTEFDPALDWSVVEWLRSVSSLSVLVKGVLTAEDARLALAAGADGIVVSNHGGRQLDGAPATLDVLPEIARAGAGACRLLLDGGVRRGAGGARTALERADRGLLPGRRRAVHGGQRGPGALRREVRGDPDADVVLLPAGRRRAQPAALGQLPDVAADRRGRRAAGQLHPLGGRGAALLRTRFRYGPQP
ncbi:alpha-hydroxy acid oxidase [Kitasatospora sp. NPDC053057]|uniref:alpha-hydroxy acid oxidase n=1 Tax=Kitasatospora sp. NPDC053057 TaxID=3364062 RepID=UPI0037CB284D